MSKEVITLTQQWLNQLGFKVTVDGLWGKQSAGAVADLVKKYLDPKKPYGLSALCWGNKLNDAEISKVAQVIQRLTQPAERMQEMMGCMAWETNRTFSPSVRPLDKNGKPISSATGLIQFMEATSKGLGTTTAKLAMMTVIEQLEYVYLYFKPNASRLKNLGDLYSAILWPAAIGQSDSFVLWDNVSKSVAAYRVNSGLDQNNDGKVTRAEILHAVTNRMVEGFLPKNLKQL